MVENSVEKKMRFSEVENDGSSRKIVILITIVIRITIKNLIIIVFARLEPDILRVSGERDKLETSNFVKIEIQFFRF